MTQELTEFERTMIDFHNHKGFGGDSGNDAMDCLKFYSQKLLAIAGKSEINRAEESYFKGHKDGYEQAEKDLGWISVKDKLPETTDYVFTCIEMAGKPQCIGLHFYKDGKWWEGYEEDSVGAVEYWMPIPELPKED